MSTRELRRRLVAHLLRTRGELGLLGVQELLAYAQDGALTDGEKRTLVRPAAVVAETASLTAAGITPDTLKVTPQARVKLLELAKSWDIRPELGGTASPTPERPLDSALAHGKDLGDPLGWTLRTSGAHVRFSTEVFGRKWPALVMEKPTFTDPSRAKPPHVHHHARIVGAEDEASLGRVLRAVVAEEQAWFDAEGLEPGSPNVRFAIQNLRRVAFVNGVRDACLGLPALGLTVNAVLVDLRDDMLSGRDHAMETGDHENYWPYWNNFVEALQKVGSQLAPGTDAAAAMDNRIHDLLRRKHVFNYRRTVDEKDAESSLGGVVIYRPPFTPGRGRRVSVVAGSDVYAPKYETLKLAETGIPEAHQALAGVPVYRHADGDLRFDVAEDDTELEPGWTAGAKLPTELHEHVVATPIPSDDPLGLRARTTGERLRTGVPLDWNGSGQIQVSPIEIGWWGHCHNEAPANAMGMNPKKGVTLYRADRAVPLRSAEVRFGEDDCWDLIGAFTSDHEGDRVTDPRTGKVSTPGYVQYSTGGRYQPTQVDETSFVGNRNNGGHWFELAPKGLRRVRIDAEVKQIWGLEDPTHEYTDPMNRFRRDIENEDGTFDPNPDWLESGMSDDDVIAVQAAGRRLTVETRAITFDAQGQRIEQKTVAVLDPSKDAFVRLADELQQRSPKGGGQLVEHWYNPKTQQYKAVSVSVANKDGKWARTQTGEQVVETTSVTASQETTYDSVTEIDEYVVKDIGLPFTFDTSSGQAVWNYPVMKVRRDVLGRHTRVEDGSPFTYTTVQLTFDTIGGPSGNPRYIIKRDAMGRTVRALALDPMPDFAFRNERWVCAPVALDRWDRPAINHRGLTRGYLTDASRRQLVPDLWLRQAIVLYAALSDETAQGHAWVFETESGKLLSFEDEDHFRAAVDADRALREPPVDLLV